MVKIANYLKFASLLLKQIANVLGGLLPQWQKIKDDIDKNQYQPE